MSRTINTMPYEIQKKHKASWKFNCGYPGQWGGAWPGRKSYTRRRNRQYRAACKQALFNNKEMPVRVREVAWDVW